MASYGNVYRHRSGWADSLCGGALPALRAGWREGGLLRRADGPHRRDKLTGLGLRLGLMGASLAALCLTSSGCGPIPAVTANGLPRVSRYASPAQLDWMLERYKEVGQAATSDAELRDQACLGWERAVFDLESGRRYPVLLRMSTDSTLLANMWQDLPTLTQRHPRPSSCAEAGSGPAERSSAGASLAPSSAANPNTAGPADNPVPPAIDSGLGGAAAAGVAQVDGPPAKSETPGTPPAGPAGAAANTSLSAPPAVGTIVTPETVVAKQRRLLARLRAVLGMPLMPSVAGAPGAVAASILRPELAPELRSELRYEIAEPALAELNELAQSDLPSIRLRARFHLLGLCTIAVEAADRYMGTPATQPLGLEKVCGPLPANKDLRRGQRRLLWSMLTAWRIKNTDRLEPMSDIVIALASFAARDNPVVDGPRGTR